MFRRVLTSASLVSGLVLASGASATIVSVTGATTHLFSPPASVMPFALTGPTAFAWDEQQGVPVSVMLDLSTNPSNSGSPVPGFMSAVVDSHFLHFQDFSGIAATGTVTFNNPIIGVVYRDMALDLTDPQSGSFGTVYPTSVAFRGLGAGSWVGINANVLTFSFVQHPGVFDLEQVRVFTQVPAPGPAALAAIGGLVALRRRRRSAS